MPHAANELIVFDKFCTGNDFLVYTCDQIFFEEFHRASSGIDF